MQWLVKIVIVASFVWSEASASSNTTPALPAAPAACVTDEELVPIEVPQLERAAHLDWLCADILDKTKGNAPDKARCTGGTAAEYDAMIARVRDAISFCQAPAGPSASVSGEALVEVQVLVKAYLDKSTCAGPVVAGLRRGVEAQTALSLLSTQDVLLRGLADFVVARANAEAKEFLAEQLSRKLCKSPDAAALLPGSCKLLAAEAQDGLAWGTLKAAFETDLARLPERALACAAHRGGAPPAIQRLLYLSAQAGRLIYQGGEPLAVLAGMGGPTPTIEACQADRAACGLYMFSYGVRLLTPRQRDGVVVHSAENLERFIQIAARRWWDHAVSIGFVAEPLANRLAVLSQHLHALRARTVELSEALRQLSELSRREGDTAGERAASVARIAGKAVALLDAWRAAAGDVVVVEAAEQERWRTGVAKVKAALQVVEGALAAYARLANREYAHLYVAVVLAGAALIRAGLGKELDEKVRRYLPFIVELAAAKTADDAKRTIETFAAPVGAGRAKRGDGHRTVALTAFAGLTGGWERAYQLEGETSFGRQGGLFMPVGIDLSWGLGKSHSLGAFLSLIDIGAFATFREEGAGTAADQKVESTPQVGLKQVFSPGAYLVWGVDRFALGVGAALTPELREVSMDGALVERASALRVGAFVAIDITILPF